MKEIEMSYEHDSIATQLITELITIPGAKPQCTLTQGFIRFEGHIFVGWGVNLRLKIFESLHLSPLGVILGSKGTIKGFKLSSTGLM